MQRKKKKIKKSINMLKISKLCYQEVNIHYILDVKFIAELIKIKLIPKKTINYCISQLLQFFFNGFFDYHKNKNVDNNYYEYYFESLIEFL